MPVRRQSSQARNFDKIFPTVHIERPVVHTTRKKVAKRRPRSRNTLLLEILRETGAGGTQVQIPRTVIDDYFHVPTSGHQTIELRFGSKPFRPAVICHFANNTHRISLPEVAGLERPLLLRFTKLETNMYAVQLIRGRKYNDVIKLCKNQTRFAARRWVVL
jgi:hypothetical protein